MMSRVDMLDNMDRLVANYTKQIGLMGNLRHALIQEWTKHMELTDVKFIALLKAYHRAVEHDNEQFTFEGEVLLTAYAKYLVEYYRTSFARMCPASWLLKVRAEERRHHNAMEQRTTLPRT
jgi:hypothetical protein